MTWIATLLALPQGDALAGTCDTITFDLPAHQPYPLTGPQEGITFDLDGTKELLTKLDCGEYYLTTGALEGKKVETLVRQVSLLESAVDLYKKRQGILESENTRIYEKWKKENKKRHEAESKRTSFSTNVGFLVLSVLAGAVGAHYLIK